MRLEASKTTGPKGRIGGRRRRVSSVLKIVHYQPPAPQRPNSLSRKGKPPRWLPSPLLAKTKR